MNIKSKIIAFQMFFVGIVLVLCGVVYFAINCADLFIDRVGHAHRQLERITELSLHANRYSEQIAEMLLFGAAGQAEFQEARRDLLAGFAALEQVTREEIEFLQESVERESEQEELALVAQMRAITERIHATALELLELTLAGQDERAQLRYYSEIEENLDDELQQLIDLGLADEREEVQEVDDETAALTRDLVAAVVAAMLIAISASVGAVTLLSRALSRPIAQLTAGAAAIGGGQLGHRIPVRGNDELALLSRHFNRMAEQVQERRQALLEQQALLEREVSERTAQLEQANRRLQDLDRLRVLFLADVSHELRTPLTVLRGEAEVTLRSRGAGTDDYRETLEGIVVQAEHMGRLVDDLLFLTRAEADSIRFELGRVRLHEVFAEAIEEGRILAAASGNKLTINGSGGPLVVTGDRQRLKQTALIAIDNAIKYADADSPIEIELRGNDGRAVVRVRNHGEPIPPKDLPYVFERFYRGRRRRPAGGSGLGLSIAKWIIEKHGGTVRLASRADGMTELEICLPRA
jgi:signal transduction histidine kinase